MAVNQGKAFEARFKSDFLKVKGASLDRIYDSVSGFKGIKNICDFIGYIFPYAYYLECKSTKQNTFSIQKLTQYDKLIEKKGIKGVNAGAVIWFIEKNRVCFVPIEEFERLKYAGYKSINVKMLDDPEFDVYEIPSEIKRKYPACDFTEMLRIADNKFNKEWGNSNEDR